MITSSFRHSLPHILTGVWPAGTPIVLTPDQQQLGVHQVSIDSRIIEPDTLFVALVGERVDGHAYVADAVARGATMALVSMERGATLAAQYGWRYLGSDGQLATGTGPILIGVDQPLLALQRWAAWHRSQHTPAWVVGITGSVGKTSTKEMVAALLQAGMPTHKSPRSYNSESTLPLVVLGLEAHHQAMVCEMGMYAAGEIALLADIARPSIGVVTAVGPSHLERMGSIEAIAHAKAELVVALPPHGVAILNADDPRVAAMAMQTQARVITYGLTADAMLKAHDIEQLGLAGTRFRVRGLGLDEAVHLTSPGLHQVRNLLAAIAVAQVAGVAWHDCVRAIVHDIEQVRFVVHQAPRGVQVIDDSYNAAPTSMYAALELLQTVARRRVAVLGDMRELGHIEREAHAEVGRWAAQWSDVLIAVGERGAWIAESAQQAGMAQVYATTTVEHAIAQCRAVVHPEDCVLIKGSRAMGMEAIVAALCTTHTPPEGK
jgi:UDP-N-acetylmuramoyl-tripeptide--D-alanyl-D-alanine ligase